MFRRREGRGSDNNCETRFARNITNHPITLGDIDNIELLPGRSLDLLKHASIQRIGSSSDLKTAVQAGWIRLKNRDNNVVNRNQVRTAIIPAVLDDGALIATTESGDIIANELIRNVKTVTADYATIEGDDVILVDATVTITLPTAVGLEGYHFIVKNIHVTGITTIATTGSETIDGQSTKTITNQYTSLTLISNNVNWFIL